MFADKLKLIWRFYDLFINKVRNNIIRRCSGLKYLSKLFMFTLNPLLLFATTLENNLVPDGFASKILQYTHWPNYGNVSLCFEELVLKMDLGKSDPFLCRLVNIRLERPRTIGLENTLKNATCMCSMEGSKVQQPVVVI